MLSKRLQVFAVVLTAGLLAACAPRQEMGMTAVMPAGRAYAEGQEIYFMHTEASNPDVSALLTDMMDSPVLLVQSLEEVPESALANVYVFTNGVSGSGPFGFQPDVFDAPPGSEGYTPLRRLSVVTWSETATPRELTSVAEVLEAEAAGELRIETTTTIINMPFVVWEGGKR